MYKISFLIICFSFEFQLLHFGIGFTNMVSRATKGSADLTRKEIKEGSQILLEKLQTFRPKIAVFNGKLIYEVFSGKKDFNFGRQPDTVHGTNTVSYMICSLWVSLDEFFFQKNYFIKTKIHLFKFFLQFDIPISRQASDFCGNLPMPMKWYIILKIFLLKPLKCIFHSFSICG